VQIKNGTRAPFLDVSKTFVMVDHSILLCKLRNNYGIRVTTLDFIGSYLRNRKP